MHRTPRCLRTKYARTVTSCCRMPTHALSKFPNIYIYNYIILIKRKLIALNNWNSWVVGGSPSRSERFPRGTAFTLFPHASPAQKIPQRTAFTRRRMANPGGGPRPSFPQHGRILSVCGDTGGDDVGKVVLTCSVRFESTWTTSISPDVARR